MVGGKVISASGKIILAGGKIVKAGGKILNSFVGRNDHLPDWSSPNNPARVLAAEGRLNPIKENVSIVYAYRVELQIRVN